MDTLQINAIVYLPEEFRQDIRHAIEILKANGCTEIFLFGSLAEGKYNEKSDIDLAVRGCPKGKFFYVLGRLLMELDHLVDLVDLDQQDAFACYLEREGELLRVG